MPRSASAIQTSLDTWYTARDAIATGQAYNVEGQQVTKADLSAVNETIDKLERELAAANAVASGRSAASRMFRGGKLGGMGY
jgi:hypothetical protein